MMDIKRVLLQWFINFFDKKTSATRSNDCVNCGIKNESISNNELVEKLHKPIIGKFEKRKVHSPFI